VITCYYGKLGQGKTYALAEHALRELKAGRHVYSNFFIDWRGLPPRRMGLLSRDAVPASNFQPFVSVDEFLEMENAFVALDEGWIYFDSYEMTRFPIDVRMKILQSRKDGLDIAYTTQRPEQVHKSLRAMTNEFYECEAGRLPFVKKPVFYRYDADLHNDSVRRLETVKWEERRTSDGSQWIQVPSEQKPKIIWPSKEVFASFDTSQKIALPSSHKSLQHAPKRIEVSKVNARSLDGIDVRSDTL